MTTAQTDTIDIVVVPRDRFSVFPRCIEAIYRHTSLPFHLTVVDGHADDATRAFLEKLESERPNVTVLFSDRLLTRGESRALAFRHVTQRLVVLLENDTFVLSDWLPPLLRCLEEERAAVVSPLIINTFNKKIHAAGCAFDERDGNGVVQFSQTILSRDRRQEDVTLKRTAIDFPEEHCILIDRSKLPGEGLFDGTVDPYDADFGLNCRASGARIFFEPDSTVEYDGPFPIRVADLDAFAFRWDPGLWLERNNNFMRKWNVQYDQAPKIRFYRRLHLLIGLARRIRHPLVLWPLNMAYKSLKFIRSYAQDVTG